MLIVFKCSRAVVQSGLYIYFNYLNEAAEREFLDLYLKSVQENSVCKEPFVLKEKWRAKLN